MIECLSRPALVYRVFVLLSSIPQGERIVAAKAADKNRLT